MAYPKIVTNLLFLICLIFTVFIYYSGLNGGYYFDDVHVLQVNKYIKIYELNLFSLTRAANSFTAGGREISMLSFALNHYFFGDSTWWYKFVNLVIHCLNGFGLYIFSGQLINRLRPPPVHLRNDSALFYLPLMVAAFWLIQPINLIPVLYISQRMALLSGFFVIYGLIFYLWARTFFTSTIRKLVYLPLGIAFFGIIGFKCKENAALLPFYVLILEIAILKFKNNRNENEIDKIVAGLFCVGAVVIAICAIYWFLSNPARIIVGYDSRYFSMSERVFTQFRALVFYIYQIIIPSNSRLSLWHDDFGLSTGLLAPPTTMLCMLLLIGIIAAGVISIRKLPLLSFGIFWFFVSHAIESTILPLELIHEHRNYLASFGILLCILSATTRALSGKPIMLYPLVIVLFVTHGAVLYKRSQIWSNETTHAEHEASIRPESASALYRLGKHYYTATEKGAEGTELLAYPLILKSAAYDRHTIIPELFLAILSKHERIDYQSNWMKTAVDKLRQYPYMSPSKAALLGYYTCLRDKKCNPPVDDVEPLFEVAYNSTESNLITTAAFYYVNVRFDNERAELAFNKALSNEAVTWVNYLGFLLYVNKSGEACSVYRDFIEKIRNRELEKVVQYARQIADFNNKLKDCENTGQDS